MDGIRQDHEVERWPVPNVSHEAIIEPRYHRTLNYYTGDLNSHPRAQINRKDDCLTIEAIFPRNRGWDSSVNRLGPAVVVNDRPTPRTARPPMKTLLLGEAACITDPTTPKNDPIWIAQRRPYRSAGSAARSAPTKPPTKTIQVIRPRISADGFPMAKFISA